MLSRAQEARVREVLGNHPPGINQTYCLEHLAGCWPGGRRLSWRGDLQNRSWEAVMLHERHVASPRWDGSSAGCDAGSGVADGRWPAGCPPKRNCTRVR